MESPECPVCLQPYEFAGGTVPRVLQCGHSACESCLSALPRSAAAPSTIRCPACNVLVRIPDLGPSALPKNIDLLRFCSSDSRSLDLDTTSIPNSKPNPNPLIIPVPWTESLYSNWKALVLPHESISSVSFKSGLETTTAFLSSSSSTTKNRRVSLIPVAAFNYNESGRLRLSYIARVMDSLTRMGEDSRGKLRLLMDASLNRCRGISRVFGLWMDPAEDLSRLFIVCECFDKGILDVLNEGKGMNHIGTFAMMAVEICEAVIEMHSQGIICGCLSPDCFAFDEYGRCILDLSRVLVSGKRIHGEIRGASVSDSAVFASPEVFLYLQGSVSAADCGFDDILCYESDVWCLACVIAMMLSGDATLGNDLFKGFHGFFCREVAEDPSSELLLDCYETWKEKTVLGFRVLEKMVLVLEVELQSLFQLLKSSLSYQPQNRPQIKELWSCIRNFLTKSQIASLASTDEFEMKGGFFSCSIIGDICSMLSDTITHPIKHVVDAGSLDNTDVSRVCSSTHRSKHAKQDQVWEGLSEGLDSDGFMSICLDAHHDCVIALAIGGGYLLSASFDKTIKMWSLQDFSLVQTLKGHEHKIMAMVVIDGAQPLCISGDSRSGIFIWHVGISTGQESLTNWYEHNDWRYSGIHSLAVSGTSHLYTGGGDKSIKAWSLQDYSLSCVMSGHRSTVSSLTVSNGVLYSGSWDGIIRLWSLYDHSLLSELGDNTPGSSYPVLSLSAGPHFVLSSYEDGCIKVWKNDLFVTSVKIQKGAIFAVHVDSRLLCTGGLDMVVSIQELFEDELHVDVRPVASVMVDSVITSLLHWHGKLFVGFSNKIKVFYTIA
ncbi:hypothetical protein KSP39_PZI023253 [Platanthera zijinensis]|uniref:Uncharacterized protein n=1 Tax=Platanthera zijinensis TaxID=2320716 RepID=A0AAP0FUN6_9ASPA